MAADQNVVALVGRLARDPELRALPSGTSVCEIRLAYTTSKKTGDQWDDVSNFVNVTVWGNQGEALARNLTKGQRVGVTGRLEHRTWQDQNGNNREAHQIVAQSVQYLTPKSEVGSPAPASRPATPAAAPAGGPVVPDDDIPFAPSVI